MIFLFFFFFKQKTAYEMRISDWSSDVCSSDLKGLQSLREYLHAAAQSVAARSATGLFRLAVDRVFTLKGHGTVVTGTVHDGVLSLSDDTLDQIGRASCRERVCQYV